MVKIFKKTMALILGLAVTATGVLFPAPGNIRTAEAADTVYNAYTAFEIPGPWAGRAGWFDSEKGLNNGQTYKIKEIGKFKNIDYNYLTQYTVFSDDAEAPVHNAGIKDVKMDKNGTYTLEMTDLSSFPKLPHIKDAEAKWNMLYISTDIPISEKNVKCTNVKVYFDDEATPFATLANAPVNQQGSTNGKSYGFYIFDNYSTNHGTKGVLDSSDKKYIRFPQKNMKITFTISGVNFDAPKKEVPVQNGLMEGQCFASGDFKYKVTTRSMSNGKRGTVAVAGTVSKAAKKSSLTIPASVTNGANKYNVTSIGKKAFASSKALKKLKTGSHITAIGTGAFKKCKKLSNIILSKNISSIGTSVFEGCTGLSKITLGSKVKSIKKSAFKGCKKLAKISISGKVKVAKGAFAGCKKTIKISGKKTSKKYTIQQIKKSGYKKVR